MPKPIPHNGGDDRSRARSFPKDRLIVVVMFVAVRFVTAMAFVLTEILFWIFIEGCLATRWTKIVSLSHIFRCACSRIFIYFHFTNWINSHFLSPKLKQVSNKDIDGRFSVVPGTRQFYVMPRTGLNIPHYSERFWESWNVSRLTSFLIDISDRNQSFFTPFLAGKQNLSTAART